MSRVFKNLDAVQLLSITRKLTSLVKLSTPPGIFTRLDHFPTTSWPPNLEILQFHGTVSDDSRFWSCLERALPTSLHTLIFEDMSSCSLWYGVPYGKIDLVDPVAFSQIKSIRLGYRRHEDSTPWPSQMTILSFFPNVENLSVSHHCLDHFCSHHQGFIQNIQRLAVTRPYGDSSKHPFLGWIPDAVSQAFWPKLWQLRVDHALVSPMLSEDGFPSGLEVAARDMQNRATMMGRDPSKAFIWKQESGIMPFED